MYEYAVLDFETTGVFIGVSRPIEIAILLVRNGSIVDRYETLMNPGQRVPREITALTGITSEMVAAAPAISTVIKEAARILGDRPIVAHSASFDKNLLNHELSRCGMSQLHAFVCTLKLSRRLFPALSTHGLENLERELKLKRKGSAHRAMSDALVTHALLEEMIKRIKSHGIKTVSYGLLSAIQSSPKQQVGSYLRRQAVSGR